MVVIRQVDPPGTWYLPVEISAIALALGAGAIWVLSHSSHLTRGLALAVRIACVGYLAVFVLLALFLLRAGRLALRFGRLSRDAADK